MVRKSDKATWKASYFTKLLKHLEEYPKCFIVKVDNVGSNQMQQIRISLRGHGEILMGKNTMIRKVIRGHLQKNPGLEKLLPHIVNNVGFVFTKGDLAEIRNMIISNKVAAPAKAGTLAQTDVMLPAQNTGMGPEKTSFFQALNIPTKISKGTIEILSDINLIKKGDRVGASEAALLQMLDIKPFSYGLVIMQVYDNGTVFEPDVLDITDDVLRQRFMIGVRNVAAVSFAINYPTKASVPHSIANAFRNFLAIAAVTDISFKQAEQMKEILADPSKLAAAVAAAAPAAPTTAAPAAAKVEEKKEEAKKQEAESDEEDMGLGLFD